MKKFKRIVKERPIGQVFKYRNVYLVSKIINKVDIYYPCIHCFFYSNCMKAQREFFSKNRECIPSKQHSCTDRNRTDGNEIYYIAVPKPSK